MPPATWIQIFSLLAGVSAGLISLLFVSFSIYVTRYELEELEKRIATIYFYELLGTLIISLSYLVLPYWWIGAFLASSLSVSYTIFIYFKHSDFVFHVENSKMKVNLYDLYIADKRARLLPLVVPSIVAISSVLGCLVTIIGSSGYISQLPLLITGIAGAWYLISASTGSWLFLLRINERDRKNTTNKHQEEQLIQKSNWEKH
jgi:hypothetical protein